MKRSKIERDEAREYRIAMEAVVDAYDEEERAMGWYYYLQDKLQFPFQASCIKERKISHLSAGDKVHAIRMAPEDECLHEMFVEIQRAENTVAVPLEQLEPLEVDNDTQEGVEDWRYWVKMGYRF